MHATSSVLRAGSTAAVLGDPTVRFRRRTAALALLAAFCCQLVTNVLYALAAAGGPGDSGSTAESLEFYAAHPVEMTVGTWFAVTGCALALVGLPAVLRVARPARPRFALIAVTLTAAGYLAYFGGLVAGLGTLPLAQSGLPVADAVDAGQMATIPLFLVFVAGNLIGTLLVGIAVILAARHPATRLTWLAGALVLGWPVGHLVNILGGGEWFAVAGGALQIVGLALVCRAAWRTPDAEWSARG